VSPHLPKRPLLAQSDKHSDLTVRLPNRDTVMAVAADSHCDFLIPERVAQKGNAPDNEAYSPDELRFILFRDYYITLFCFIQEV